MTKKFVISLLVMVVVAGLSLFAYNQVGAQPSRNSDCLKCPNGSLGFTEFASFTGDIAAVFYCPPEYADPEGKCICVDSQGNDKWEVRPPREAWFCPSPGNGCRQVTNASLGAGCNFNRCLGGRCF